MSRSGVQLHLLRHAHAGDAMKWHGPDDLRPLSERGRRQAEAMGRFLAAAGFAPDAIITSPLTRAVETAQLAAAPLGRPVIIDDRLARPLDPSAIEAILADADDPARPVLVGHDPDFTELLGELTGLGSLVMRKGQLARIDLRRPVRPGEGLLRWLVPPELVLPGELDD
jgi:phosphohistidine phosphatase